MTSTIKYPPIKGSMRNSLVFPVWPNPLLYLRYFHNYIWCNIYYDFGWFIY